MAYGIVILATCMWVTFFNKKIEEEEIEENE